MRSSGLDLIDGFSGGGTFTDEDGIVSGTPLIMIEESEAAQERLSRNRSKPLVFDFKYYFTDADPFHVDHLRAVLNERGQMDDERIIVRNSRFEDEVDRIIAEILRRQPRAGRAIFLLDQTRILTCPVESGRQDTPRTARPRRSS